ncbi:MAG: response regulator [Desulfobacterales bacterium]|nr:response regulator [Desulfobacterales bacterium]
MDEIYRVLLVEDDERLASLIQEYLKQHNFEVAVEHRGDQAVERILAEKPDLVILDLMLPGLDGLDVCKAVRPDYTSPILMLTARDEDTDQVVGLEIGADDYVTKPVQPRVLLARVRALLRRSRNEPNSHKPPKQPGNPEELIFGRLHINRASRGVWLDRQEIELTTNDFELLWLLAEQAGKILDRDEILTRLRGIGYDGMDRSVDMRISRLRKKLGDDSAKPCRIKTVWAQGYLFVKDTWS